MDKELLLTLTYAKGIGTKTIATLFTLYSSFEALQKASQKDLQERIGQEKGIMLYTHVQQFSPTVALSKLSKRAINVITREDASYPKQLLGLEDAPFLLFARASSEHLDRVSQERFVAVVGTRSPTSYGISITNSFTEGVVGAGFSVVSGLARGVDTLAHRKTLQHDGFTVAFLGCGIDIVYPPENANLYEEIAKQGVIFSEFPPGTITKPGMFVSRNRLVAGLAEGVLVTEGTATSGSLITARLGVEQGKEVFAIPGPIHSSQSAAAHILLKQGAQLVTSPEEIVTTLGGIPIAWTKQRPELSGLELALYEKLSLGAQEPEELARQLNISIIQLLELSSTMELEGIITVASDGKLALI